MAWITVGILLIILMFQSRFEKGFTNSNINRIFIAEKRTKHVNEVITGMKIIKFNAWEKVMNDKMKVFRDKEGGFVMKAFTYFNISQALSTITPTVLGLTVFLLHEYINKKKLEVYQIYPLIALFNSTLAPIRYFILSMMNTAEAKKSASRIEKLMSIEKFKIPEDNDNLRPGEVQLRGVSTNWEDPEYFSVFNKGKKIAEKAKNTFILKDIDLKINQGEFIAVVGKVGSGKTSLLLSLMDEMVRQQGDYRKNGQIAYISQESFLQNDSVRENIVFGKKYSKSRFEKTLKICEMETDIDMLDKGDLTEVAEGGANLSGGQRQRINIARAVYSDSDIYLIDDALSALDPEVGNKVMDNVFLGELGNKTRVMVTQFLHLLDKVDKVILIDEGEIKAFGPLDKVKNTEAFESFSSKKREREEEELEKSKKESETPVRTFIENMHEGLVIENQLLRQSRVASTKSSADSEIMEKEEIHNEIEHRRTTIAPSFNTQTVGTQELRDYVRSAGTGLSLLTFFLFLLSVIAKIACDWWVGKWTEDAFKQPEETYIIMYAFGGLTVLLLMILRAYALAFVSKRAAIRIYKKLFWNILRRPMSFFHTTPAGNIINICSSDVDKIDYDIPFFSSYFFPTFFTFVGSIVLASIISPMVILLVLIAYIVLVRCVRKFFRTYIELAKISQRTISPLISIASEFIDGVTVIRTFGRRNCILKRYIDKADIQHSATFMDYASILWLRFRVETVLNLITVAIVFSTVLGRNYE